MFCCWHWLRNTKHRDWCILQCCYELCGRNVQLRSADAVNIQEKQDVNVSVFGDERLERVINKDGTS